MGNETSGYLQSEDGQLYATWHEPAQTLRAGALILPPYGEERKCASRLLVAIARQLATVGIGSLRFDYRGTGESSGELEALSLAAWREDVRQAAGEVRARAGEAPLLLIGARLGGLLATEAAAAVGAAALLLLEPIPAGGDLVEELLRRKQVKEMMGGGQASSEAADAEVVWASGGVIDFDGFPMAAAFSTELRAELLLPRLEALEVPVRILHISGAKRLTGKWAAIGEHCEGRPTHILTSIREKPFWGRTDHHESEEILREVQGFCDDALA